MKGETESCQIKKPIRLFIAVDAFISKDKEARNKRFTFLCFAIFVLGGWWGWMEVDRESERLKIRQRFAWLQENC